ncbi:MAG: hypothetical protein COX79_05620 [Candidatus Levybacteria bacterium CG_4_10_14_0_2_um_filter_36_16]|nr:MAG: hypothetical protein AUK12_01370 [Candidatus Levybacteria bacterium CG2_30_37_29]PIR78733.1 MAG: hypothetical protein COU26_04830 [Candidatus Levybacteria bacterium CG10_big_fil_rev_8_21_14_0_10_36_30]PIZ96148.1 MAG: hypothetical protein COX79_05620 [Candidatus Levybacteria bacterium CG_4_10_14_0_2_um_filter_36_16]
MKQKKIDFVKLLKGFKSGWVGISTDHKKVLVHGETLKEAKLKAEEKKLDLFFFPAGERYDNFVG